MSGKSLDAAAPLPTQAESRERRRGVPVPTNLYTVFLILLNLATLSVAMYDVRGIALVFLSMAYTVHVRLLLTQREEQRRTNELLEEMLDAPSPLPRL